MGILSKVTHIIDKATGGALGWVTNPAVKMNETLTGLKASEQATAGLSAGAIAGATGLDSGGLGEIGSLLSSGLSSLSSGLGSLGSFIGSGISGLGSALLQLGGDYFNREQQWKYDKQAMELQNQFNLAAERRQNQYNIQAENRAMQNNIQLWNMQNQYNTPAAQMQRLKDAGLNPNLAYGTANTTAGSISAPASHGVTTRANKAIAKQAMALNYQQIVSNQLQNQLLAEQIADKKASRLLAVEEMPLNLAYKQAQIDAIKNGYGLRVNELGLRSQELRKSREFQRDKEAWDRYQDDLRNYYQKEDQLPYFGKYWLRKAMPSIYQRKMGRRPMFQDYL